MRQRRHELGIRPAYRRVDSCAGEVDAASSYYYSTWGETGESPSVRERPSVVILGSGPNRIGQGIEFDYCCVHAAKSFRDFGFDAVMVNCNPETVSTDYDTSDRLYFEPLTAEHVLEVCAHEEPVGVVTQFGGQTPLKLARAIEERGTGSSGRHTPRSTSPRTASASARSSASSASAARRRGGSPRGVRRGGADRLPGARPPVVRARRAGDAGLLRRRPARGGDACGGTGPRRPLRRARDRARRRRALRRRGRLHRGGHAARGGGRRPLRRLVRPAGPVAHVAGSARGGARRQAPRAGAGRRRAAERPARDRRRHRVRPRGEPPRLADGPLRQQGDRREPRGRRLPACGRRVPPRPGAARAETRAGQREGRSAAVFAVPGAIPCSARRCARPGR